MVGIQFNEQKIIVLRQINNLNRQTQCGIVLRSIQTRLVTITSQRLKRDFHYEDKGFCVYKENTKILLHLVWLNASILSSIISVSLWWKRNQSKLPSRAVPMKIGKFVSLDNSKSYFGDGTMFELYEYISL